MLDGLQGTYTKGLNCVWDAWKSLGPTGDGSKGHWSDETICEFIVVYHHSSGAHKKTGIVFTLEGEGDESKRKTANCRRIKRYMESAMVLEMLPSILGAMPAHLANQYWDNFTRLAGRRIAALDPVDESDITNADLAIDCKEGGESVAALAAYVADPTEANLMRYIHETNEAIEVKRGIVRKALAKIAPKGAYAKIVNKIRQSA